jgi:hypothetical protein
VNDVARPALAKAAPATDALVMRVAGPWIAELVRGEEGCHLWQPTSQAPELLRVRVLPVEPGVTPIDRLRAHLDARAADDRGEAVVDPMRPLPLVRRIAFEPRPALQGGALGPPASLRLEDFAMQSLVEMRARSLADPFGDLLLLRLSHERDSEVAR